MNIRKTLLRPVRKIREILLQPIRKNQLRKQYLCYDFPFSIGLSLGEFKCNRQCRMCPQYTNPPVIERYISDEVIERACREIGVRNVSIEISAYGETFMHPKADDFLYKVRELCPKATIVVATNGSLLDRHRCEKIVESGIDHLSFSLDAGSRESYQWLCKATDYEQLCRNLETLVEIRNNLNAKHLKITTHIIGIKELSHEFDPFIKRWSGIVDQAYVRTYGNWAGLVDQNGISPAESQKIPDKRYPCAWLWYATKIEPNGDVSKCFIHVTGDKNPLGNIMQQSFESIWQGRKLEDLRNKHCQNDIRDIEFCKDCIVWSLFPNFWKERQRNDIQKTNEWV
jgi:radical SAM protein with 4Fe4S-binding SPASM domain